MAGGSIKGIEEIGIASFPLNDESECSFLDDVVARRVEGMGYSDEVVATQLIRGGFGELWSERVCRIKVIKHVR